MSWFKNTLQQEALGYEKTQGLLINNLIKKAPFLDTVPFITSTHGKKNNYIQLTGFKGADFRADNGLYAQMDGHFELKTERLGKLGGEMSLTEDIALDYAAGRTNDAKKATEEWFSKITPTVLAAAGESLECHLIYNVLQQRAIAYSAGKTGVEKTCRNAGGTTSGQNYSILIVKQNKEENCGLVSPSGKNNDEVLYMEWENGGQRHKLVSSDPEKNGRIGYAATWDGIIGYQVARPDQVGAIFNIDPSTTGAMVKLSDILELLAIVDADASDTQIVMHPVLKAKIFGEKWDKVQLGTGDRNLITGFDRIENIPIISTKQMAGGTEAVVSGF